MCSAQGSQCYAISGGIICLIQCGAWRLVTNIKCTGNGHQDYYSLVLTSELNIRANKMHQWTGTFMWIGHGVPGPTFGHCEFLWCQVLPRSIRFLDAACSVINTEYWDPFFRLNEEPRLWGGLFSWILSSGSECKLGNCPGVTGTCLVFTREAKRQVQRLVEPAFSSLPGDSGCVPSFRVRGWCKKESDYYASSHCFTAGRRLGWQWQAWVIFLCRDSCPALGNLHSRQEVSPSSSLMFLFSARGDAEGIKVNFPLCLAGSSGLLVWGVLNCFHVFWP